MNKLQQKFGIPSVIVNTSLVANNTELFDTTKWQVLITCVKWNKPFFQWWKKKKFGKKQKVHEVSRNLKSLV